MQKENLMKKQIKKDATTLINVANCVNIKIDIEFSIKNRITNNCYTHKQKQFYFVLCKIYIVQGGHNQLSLIPVISRGNLDINRVPHIFPDHKSSHNSYQCTHGFVSMQIMVYIMHTILLPILGFDISDFNPKNVKKNLQH